MSADRPRADLSLDYSHQATKCGDTDASNYGRGGRGVKQRKRYRRESEEGDAVLRWLRADIVGLICHLQVCAYYREAKSEQNVR